MGMAPLDGGAGKGTVFPTAVSECHKGLSAVPADERVGSPYPGVRSTKVCGTCPNRNDVFFAWDLHEYSTTYETRIRLGWNNPAISCFHTTQSIFAAECGDCLFLETKAFGDGGVVDPLHTHGGDMFFLVSCHVSSGLVVLEWMECYVNVSCCDTSSVSRKPALVSPDCVASDPLARLP